MLWATDMTSAAPTGRTRAPRQFGDARIDGLPAAIDSLGRCTPTRAAGGISVAHGGRRGDEDLQRPRAPGGRHKMSRTFTNLLTHIVFSTKDREPLIVA